ncbi:4-pyridoxate dehydrogenase-like [Rhipicephalus sanguineus]|uniref:4-pyridoxate dehydrogenase-like n=1 Tax=Rhipicephalus sanguineus TaxID=34632 RepID=UPI0020C376E9|nr:4-pyridoxate dehydrogenase-like [Rhipicephalus sanguineus]
MMTDILLRALPTDIVVGYHRDQASGASSSNETPGSSRDICADDDLQVGAGSAGCALAKRLTADGMSSVLLLEAGGLEGAAVQVPFLSAILQRSSIDWDYTSEPQHNASLSAENQINRFPRGKVFGGSSSINHLIYARGNRKDYDKWASHYGAEGWSYDDVLPDFLSIETSYLGIDNGYHGDSGEVPVSFPSSRTKVSDLFLEAGRELGYGNGDYNGPNQTSFSRVQNNVKKGERWSSSKAFIPDDVRRRKNIDVALYAHVTKVIFEGTTAVGVEYKRHLGTHKVRARKEVILCAGAIGSAQLLMLSGVGPREHLESLGISVIADLPVGENLYDHVTVNGIAATSAENIQLDYYSPSALFKYARFGSGPLSHAYGVECVAFLSTPGADPTLPNIQFLLVNLNPTTIEAGYIAGQIGVSEIYEKYYKKNQGQNAFMVVPILLHPKSSGFIQLKSTNPAEYPIIDPKFLTNAADLDTLVEGSKIAVQALTTQAMRNGNVTIWDIALPACESAGPMWSDPYLRCFVQHTSLSGWHPCCTAPMGKHPQAVLDARLRVRGGVKNLRVVDASSMPYLPAGNLNAPLMMMGHRAAAMIIEDNAMPLLGSSRRDESFKDVCSNGLLCSNDGNTSAAQTNSYYSSSRAYEVNNETTELETVLVEHAKNFSGMAMIQAWRAPDQELLNR